MRAEEHRVDAAPSLGHQLVHAGVDGIEGGHVEQTPAHAGLIGRHHDAEARLVQAGDGLQAARDGIPLLRTLDELVGVVVDDPVTVEDDELHDPSRSMPVRHFGLPR